MKKSYLISNLLLAILILVGDVFYITTDFVWVKAITSVGFVLLGAINLCYLFKVNAENKKFGVIMLIGLIFACAGDIALEFIFELGAGLFAIGHIFFFVAYCSLIKFNWKDLIPFAIIFIPVLLFILLAPIFEFGGIFMEIVCIVYALIISVMVGKAISNCVKDRSLLNIVILIGSILFMFSDLMLLFNNFTNLSRVFLILCLATYYPAEIILAISLLFAKKNLAEVK